MAQFELNIYGENDEIIKTYATDKVRWGIFLEAQKINEELDGMSELEQLEIVSVFVKKIFPELTDAHLALADIDDVMNNFKQLLKKAGKIGSNAKNLIGAV